MACGTNQMQSLEWTAAVQQGESRQEISATLEALLQVDAALLHARFNETLVGFFSEYDTNDTQDFVMSNECCREAVNVVKDYFAQGELSEQMLHASNDFHKLFIGPNKLLAPPWSSVYVDKGSLFGPTALEVENEFKKNGFVIASGKHEPFDHISFELEYLTQLHKKAQEAYVAGDLDAELAAYQQALTFKERYVDIWANDFLDAVEKGARVDIYRGVAKLVRGSLELEGQFLDAVILPGEMAKSA